MVREYGKDFRKRAVHLYSILQFTSMKCCYNILVNKSGEKVNFFAASLQFNSMKCCYNILVNKSGEKVNFFAASLQVTSMKYSYNILVNKSAKKSISLPPV